MTVTARDEFGRKCWPWNLVNVPFVRCGTCERRGECGKYRVKRQEAKRGWWT